MPALPTVFLGAHTCPCGSFQVFMQKGAGDWGRGASHFCCTLKLAPRLVDPHTPGGPSLELTQPLAS